MHENTPKAEVDKDKVVLSFRFEQYSFSKDGAEDIASQLQEAANELDE